MYRKNKKKKGCRPTKVNNVPIVSSKPQKKCKRRGLTVEEIDCLVKKVKLTDNIPVFV